MFKRSKKHKTPGPIPGSWPRFGAGVAKRRWTHPSGKERVYLISRHDGLFVYASEYFSDAEFEHCWIPEGVGKSFFDSEPTAVRELHVAYPWSRDVSPEGAPDA
jgi:hypothetical protein